MSSAPLLPVDLFQSWAAVKSVSLNVDLIQARTTKQGQVNTFQGNLFSFKSFLFCVLLFISS